MPYGILKADTLTYYTASGDISIPVSGIAATVSGTIAVPSGTAAAPSISYVGDPDTGFYSPAADQVAIATSGTGKLFVDGIGNVGIGTASGVSKLDVIGTITSRPSGAVGDYGVAQIYGNAGASSGITINSTFSSGGWGPIVLKTTDTERLRIDNAGRLLVGTSTASNFIGAGYASFIQVQETTALLAFGIERATNDLSGGSLNFRKTRSTTNGDVTVVQSGDALGQLRFLGTDGTGSIHSADIRCEVDGTPGTNDMPGRLIFSTTADGASTPTERMRISNSGVVTIKNGAVAEIGTLTDGATITPDFAANCNFTVTITGNRTIANPTNITAGQAGSVFIVQGSGSNTVSWGSYWDFPSGTAPTLSTASGAVDRVDYIVRTATSIHTVFTANYS